jgi:hypothetical protein
MINYVTIIMDPFLVVWVHEVGRWVCAYLVLIKLFLWSLGCLDFSGLAKSHVVLFIVGDAQVCIGLLPSCSFFKR